jgi:alpha-galactosidase
MRYPEADHFPNGLAPVVEYVHSKGLVFGLYTCAGTETCVGHRPGSKVPVELLWWLRW